MGGGGGVGLGNEALVHREYTMMEHSNRDRNKEKMSNS